MNVDKINDVKSGYDKLNEVVEKIVRAYTKDLDKIIVDTRDKLDKKLLTSAELQKVIIEIPLAIYFVNTELERIILKENIAKELSKVKYNEIISRTSGTVATKTAEAESGTVDERMVEYLYKTTSNRIKSKIDTLEELLNSCKKVLTFRISELELEGGDNY